MYFDSKEIYGKIDKMQAGQGMEYLSPGGTFGRVRKHFVQLAGQGFVADAVCDRENRRRVRNQPVYLLLKDEDFGRIGREKKNWRNAGTG